MISRSRKKYELSTEPPWNVPPSAGMRTEPFSMPSAKTARTAADRSPMRRHSDTGPGTGLGRASANSHRGR